MKINRLSVPDVVVITPSIFKDLRGEFFEAYREAELSEALGIDVSFVGTNFSFSAPKVMRGLHYQTSNPQGKLVRCLKGCIFDVSVDMRRSSPTFGKVCTVFLSADTYNAVWVPPGFAHGFLNGDKSDCIVSYSVTSYHDAASEQAIRWDAPDLGIAWPVWMMPPTLSDKDANSGTFSDARPCE